MSVSDRPRTPWAIAAPAAPPVPADLGDEPAAPDAAGNWLWLADARPGSAVVLGPAPDSVVEATRAHFDPLLVVTPAAHVARAVPDASVDWVIATNVLESPAPDAAAALWLLRHCRRVLRARGVCCIAAPNPFWHGVLAPRASESGSRGRLARLADGLRRTAGPGALPGLLRQAGFPIVLRYYVEPALEAPRAFVPATAEAIRAYERLQPPSTLRSLLATLGLHAALFPDTFFLAYA